MTAYQTTRPIKSLAKDGVNLGARQYVTPQAFTPGHWAALLGEGAVVEIPKAEDTAVSLNDLSIDKLKALADERGVSYTWNIKRETLIERLENA